MTAVRIPKVVQLAEELAASIRESGLTPGDPYMNAAAVARELRVSASTANRVLQILAERGIVERAQKRGTRISNPDPEQPVHAIARVHMITFQNTVRQSGLMTDPVIVGMQRKLPGAMIQFNFLPPMGRPDYLARLLDEARRSAAPVGIVLTKAPAHAQRMVAESGIAAVAHGYPQAGVRRLPWITNDYAAAGHLAGRFCADVGAARLALVLPDRPILEGDYRLMVGAQAVMARAGYRADAVTMRCFSPEGHAPYDWMRAHAREVAGKTVFVLHPRFLSNHGKKGAGEKALPPRTRSELIVIDEFDRCRVGLKRTVRRIHSRIRDVEVGERIGALLAARVGGARVGEEGDILPVELAEMT